MFEIKGHTWQFPLPEVARMLSPKKPKSGINPTGELLSLNQYDCVADEPYFHDTLDDAVSRLQGDNWCTSQLLNCHDFAKFLSRCTDACHNSLDAQPRAPLRQDRWYKDIRFTVRGGPETTSGASVPLSSDAGRGLQRLVQNAVSPDPLENGSASKTTILVDVQMSWKDIVFRAFYNVRYLFGKSRARSFALVPAFSENTNELRFLILHPGGLTASEPCNLADSGWLKEATRVLLALLFWTTSFGAGFVPFCTDAICALPANDTGEECALATVDGLLSQSPQIPGRMTQVSRLYLSRNSQTGDNEAYYARPTEILHSESDSAHSEIGGPIILKTGWQDIGHRANEANMHLASNGQFGTVPHVCSYEGVGEHREVMSNILFLPRQEEILDRHWAVFGDDPPVKPDLRTFWYTILGAEGRSLVQANSPRQLSRAWVHFILGWLSIYLSGYLHQDISIGSVLMTAHPIKQKAFEVPGRFLEHLSSLEDTELAGEIRTLCSRLQELVAELGISEECTAFVAGGDLAVPWRHCLSKENKRNTGGTIGFLSRSFKCLAYGLKEPYIRTPIDDLESCFWVAIWSVVFNKDSEESSSTVERMVRESLARGCNSDALDTFRLLYYLDEHSSNIVQRFFLVIEAWRERIWSKPWDWSSVVANAPADADEEFYLPRFHRSALRGVVDVLEVMAEYWDGEISWESWTAPQPD